MSLTSFQCVYYIVISIDHQIQRYLYHQNPTYCRTIHDALLVASGLLAFAIEILVFDSIYPDLRFVLLRM
ncbi:uncharacterized protein PHALS_15295 [Plasmopara halstedii]|uniref:Uncharacterized protein n=1 Tax=Plasmopara halstedii TaxID=4781 RepID=A0A0P1ABB2_PLAHL|nr:uncharacterized protein PHALS_15295 [Plasmopara halstedii]CEG38186.1 hypothetical protein PHALS_15295 [Plasmopara halstedii]|eukprot:XP_024574555.1 hypothetical protein PHALS_15295 [Plasmopara halstedii]